MLKSIFQLSRYDPAEVVTLRKNLHAHLYDGIFFGVASCFISQQTVLPVFLRELGGSPVAIGAIPVLWTLGTNLPQILFLPVTHRGGKIKPVMLWTSLLLRLLYGVLALATAFVVGRESSASALMIMLGIIGLMAIAGSMAGPPWQQLFTLTVTVNFRGRLLALRQLLTAGIGIAAGSAVMLILSRIAWPVNFAVLFGLTFVLSMISLWFLTRLKEPEYHPVHDDPGIPFDELYTRALTIVRTDGNFRRFLIGDAAQLLVFTAPGFFAVFAMEKFHLAVSDAGTFTMITMASMVVANAVGGYLADHIGNKINLILISCSMTAACLVSLIAGTIHTYSAVFFFMACAVALQGISRQQFVSELASDADRPLYITLTNTLTAPIVCIGLLAGQVAAMYGFEPALMLYGIISAGAAVWIAKNVREPRRKEVEVLEAVEA